eukprot:g4567.t1
MWHRKTRVHLATQQSPLQKNRLLIEKVNKENRHIQIKTDFFLHPKSIEKNLLAVKPQNVPHSFLRSLLDDEVDVRVGGDRVLPATGNQCYGRWWMRAYRGTRRTLEKKREGEQSFFSLSEKLRRNDVSGKQWNYPQANSELTGYAVAYSKMY